jgi:hypothetical protein
LDPGPISHAVTESVASLQPSMLSVLYSITGHFEP